jgi:disulfide bond formation protein DsbB
MSSQQPQSSNEVFPVFQLLVLFGAVAVMLSILMAVTPKPTPIAPTETPVQVDAAEPTQMPSAVPPTEVVEVAAVALDPEQVRAGESIFQASCAACHGFNARGISGLGLPMIGSEFINGLTDDELHDFLLVGRPVTDPANSTGVAMPARGGNPSLTDDDLYNVIAYIRSLNVPADSAAVPTTAPTAAPTASGPTLTPTEFVPPAVSIASADVPDDEAEVPAAPDLFLSSGEVAYNRSCAGCHGLDGEGVPLIGPALTDSDLLTDREGIGLLEFLTREEPPVDPREGYPHPYRGGYPLLTDEQILNIIAYLYELTGQD